MLEESGMASSIKKDIIKSQAKTVKEITRAQNEIDRTRNEVEARIRPKKKKLNPVVSFLLDIVIVAIFLYLIKLIFPGLWGQVIAMVQWIFGNFQK